MFRFFFVSNTSCFSRLFPFKLCSNVSMFSEKMFFLLVSCLLTYVPMFRCFVSLRRSQRSWTGDSRLRGSVSGMLSLLRRKRTRLLAPTVPPRDCSGAPTSRSFTSVRRANTQKCKGRQCASTSEYQSFQLSVPQRLARTQLVQLFTVP